MFTLTNCYYVSVPSNSGNSGGGQKGEGALNSALNVSGQCLSTIEECSNETFESACSNQSRNPVYRRSHSTSYEEDGDEQLQNSEWAVEKRRLGEMARNVTVRRRRRVELDGEEEGGLEDEEHTIRESGPHAENSMPPKSSTDAVIVTDRLFEEFCLVANDEIMACPSLASFTDSLESSSASYAKWVNVFLSCTLLSLYFPRESGRNEICDTHAGGTHLKFFYKIKESAKRTKFGLGGGLKLMIHKIKLFS